MARKYLYHETGWQITDDPLYVPTKGIEFQIDLAAERLIVAEKDSEKIAVEVKSMAGPAQFYDFYQSLG